jgi:hypothetical protein
VREAVVVQAVKKPRLHLQKKRRFLKCPDGCGAFLFCGVNGRERLSKMFSVGMPHSKPDEGSGHGE